MRTCYIDETEVIILSDWQITQNLESRSTMTAYIIDTNNPIITDGATFQMYNGEDKIFEGIISKISKKQVSNTNKLKYSIEIIDNSAIADRRVIAKSYTSRTADYIVNDIVSTVLIEEGVTAGRIDEGVTLTKAVFNYITCTRALDDICMRCGFIWNIDKDKKLNFINLALNVYSNTLNDSLYHWNFSQISTLNDYRNVQYVRGGKGTTATQTNETPSPACDGKSRSFTLRYPIATQPTIELNIDGAGWVAISSSDVGVNGLNSDEDKKWFWSYDSQILTQHKDETVLTSSDAIRVTYVGLRTLFVKLEDSNQISQMGKFEKLDVEKSIVEQSQAIEFANGLISKYGEIADTINFETIVDGFEIGQLIKVDKSNYGINGTFLIDSISITGTPSNLVYKINAVDGASVGGWEKYFEKLLKLATDYSINENDQLVLLNYNKEKTSLSSATTVYHVHDIYPTYDMDNYTTYILNIIRKSWLTNLTSSIVGGTSLTLSPAFDSDTTEYTSLVPYLGNVGITPSCDENTLIVYDGENVTSGELINLGTLNVGETLVEVTSTSLSNDASNVYSVTFTKLSTLSNLTSRIVGGASITLSPTFSVDTLSYSGTIPYSATNVSITPYCDANTKIIYDGVEVTSGTAVNLGTLPIGENEITVSSTDLYGDYQKDFLVILSKLAVLSGLSAGIVGGSSITLSPTFSAGTTTYSGSISYSGSNFETQSVKLTPTCDGSTKIIYDGDEVVSGSDINIGEIPQGLTSTIITAKTSTDKAPRDYTVNITRNNSVYLSALIPSRGDVSVAINKSNTTIVVDGIGSNPATSTLKFYSEDPSAIIGYKGTNSNGTPVTYVNGQETGELSVAEGSSGTQYYIVISASGQSDRNYNIRLRRLCTVDSIAVQSYANNAYVANLSPSPSFNTYVFDYTYNVDFSSDFFYPYEIRITPVCQYPSSFKMYHNGDLVTTGSTISMGEIPVGDNIFELVVKNAIEEPTATVTYTLTVHKYHSTHLNNLTSSKGTLTTSITKSRTDYHITGVGSSGTCTITITLEDTSSVITLDNYGTPEILTSGVPSSSLTIPAGTDGHIFPVAISSSEVATINYTIHITR